MLNQIKEVIEQYEIICIYRHVFPDGDAKGSQFGLKTWIESKYPNKQVYAIGQDTPNSFFPNCYHGEVEFEKALAIIVDTANHQRIDGEGWDRCDKIIKIDHHPAIDQYGALNFVREEACAASEIIGEMFMEANEQLSKESATYLYCGLIADSQKFSIPTTTSKTLQVASYLINFGVDIQTCNLRMFSDTKQRFEYKALLRTKVQYVEPGLAYIITTMDEYEKFGLTFDTAKNVVDVMANVDGFDIWVVYTEQTPGFYSGSFRSKNTTLNDIVAHYGGGGHNFASGAKNLTLSDIESANKELVERLKEIRG